MADSRNAIEQIRQRINIIDVVSDYVAIKRAGKSSKGLCPFHSEKTPSFTVSEEFQTWHCFGCGEHGDVFSFLMKVENLTFAEVLERLAKRAGVVLEAQGSRQPSSKDVIGKTNLLALTYFRGILKKSRPALEYLEKRGLTEETVEKFQLGCAAPEWDGLANYLTGKRVGLDKAALAGLVIKNDRGGYYDRFRNRVIFPIFDIQERVIAFGGRTLGDDQAKYLNSPETPLFSKNRSLYGMNFARKSISEIGYVIVVEGYTDVMMTHQAGFTNCVATLGTALTVEHIGVLSRYTNKIVLAYDSDSAGMKAALRGAAMFDEADCLVRIARLPAGDDPDSLLRKGKVEEFRSAIRGALPIVAYKLALIQEAHDLGKPGGRQAMLREAVKVLSEVSSSLEREKYIKTLAGYHPNFGSGTTRAEDHIRNDVDTLIRRRQGIDSQTANKRVPRPSSAVEKAERIVLRVLIEGGEDADIVRESLDADAFSSEISRRAARAIFEMLKKNISVNLPELLGESDAETGKYISELAMREDAPPISEEAVRDCISLLKKNNIRKKRTPDILAPYMKDGIINPSDWTEESTAEDYEAFLRESGKRRKADEK